jgi:NAD(P)-dependent dehydrogenase (short-subunit alcohol dehydrogenase family)
MSGDFEGKAVLITGAASGIGRAAAVRFAEAGAKVMVADLDEAGAQDTAAQVGGASVRCDVSDPADVEAAVAATVEQFGGLDVLVNNAGMPHVGPVTESSVEDLPRLAAVNLGGVFHGIKYATPRMVKRGGGSIVSTASGAGLRGTPMMGLYAATKAAVINLTQTAALELRPLGIRVNCVCPGMVDTPMLVQIRDAFEAFSPVSIDAMVEMKQGRYAVPNDIAEAIVELASDRLGFVSGVIVPVDNAMSASLF